MYCNYCGSQNPEDANYCSKCGKSIVRPDQHPDAPKESSQSVPQIAGIIPVPRDQTVKPSVRSSAPTAHARPVTPREIGYREGYIYAGLTLLAAAVGWYKLFAAVTTDPPPTWEYAEFEVEKIVFVVLIALWNGFLLGSAAMIAGKHRLTMAMVCTHSVVAALGVLVRGLILLETAIAGVLIPAFILYFRQRREMFVGDRNLRVGSLPPVNVRAMWVVVLTVSSAMGMVLGSFIEESARTWFKKGHELSQGIFPKHDEAVAAYRKAIRFKGDYGEAWHNLGLSYSNLGQHVESAAAQEKAVQLRPNDPQVWFALGSSYEELNQHDQAIRAYEKAVELKPDYAEAWYELMLLYADRGNRDDAIRAYKEVAKLKPDLLPANLKPRTR